MHGNPTSLSRGFKLLRYIIGLNFTSYIPTPWNWALLGKPIGPEPLKNLPAFYGALRFITVLTRALHWSLSWATSVWSIPPHPVSLGSILVLSSHPHLGGLFSLSHRPISIHLLPHTCHISCPSHPLDLIILIIFGEECKLWSFSLCSFIPTSCHFIPLRSKYTPQRPVLKRHVPLLMSDTKFHTHTELQAN
jgi:hypothetical protein